MSTQERRERGGRSVAQMVVVGVLASAIGIAFGIAIDWFPADSSTQAGPIDTLWDVLIVASVPMFVLVSVVVVFAVIDFRMRPGEENLDGPPIHGNTRLEIIWTAVPSILIVALCVYAFTVLSDIEDAPADQPERQVTVIGQQFAWTFEYNEGGRKFTNTQLYLPVGESVKFNVRSNDVIHDFWVPNFRMKIDAVPGITTHYRVTPTQTGRHEIVCAELCGLGHAYMRQTAHVLSQERFDAWVRRASRTGTAGGEAGGAGGEGTDEQSGPGAGDESAKDLFVNGDSRTNATACGACHTLADAGTNGQTGPNLDESLQGKDAAYIEQGIIDPDSEIAEGYSEGIMPGNYKDTLSDAQVKALTDYLGKVTR